VPLRSSCRILRRRRRGESNRQGEALGILSKGLGGARSGGLFKKPFPLAIHGVSPALCMLLAILTEV
jgi:hypothetical protein